MLYSVYVFHNLQPTPHSVAEHGATRKPWRIYAVALLGYSFDMSIGDYSTEKIQIDDDGTFPNNAAIPLVFYKSLKYRSSGSTGMEKSASADASESAESLARVLEELFSKNGWPPRWRNGVYPYHHYHSTAHEVLGVFLGNAIVQFGGPEGPHVDVAQGNVVMIPAGVSHKLIDSSSDFTLVGAYPKGQSPDMNYGDPGERPEADENIADVPAPALDPVTGAKWPV